MTNIWDWIEKERKKDAERAGHPLQDAIGEMFTASEEERYEDAATHLQEVERILEEVRGFSLAEPRPATDTLDHVHRRISGPEIRVGPGTISGTDKYLSLIEGVLKRVGDRDMRTDDFRRIVADEMKCQGLSVRKVRPGAPKSEKPNRAFLDTLERAAPGSCAKELERRAEVKLRHAIRQGDKKGIERAKKEIKKHYWWFLEE